VFQTKPGAHAAKWQRNGRRAQSARHASTGAADANGRRPQEPVRTWMDAMNPNLTSGAAGSRG
jgi:hypothetical protein